MSDHQENRGNHNQNLPKIQDQDHEPEEPKIRQTQTMTKGTVIENKVKMSLNLNHSKNQNSNNNAFYHDDNIYIPTSNIPTPINMETTNNINIKTNLPLYSIQYQSTITLFIIDILKKGVSFINLLFNINLIISYISYLFLIHNDIFTFIILLFSYYDLIFPFFFSLLVNTISHHLLINISTLYNFTLITPIQINLIITILIFTPNLYLPIYILIKFNIYPNLPPSFSLFYNA